MRHFLLASLLLLTSGISVQAQTAPSFEQQVLEVIKRNPDAVVDAIRVYQSRSAKDQRRAEWQQFIANPARVDTTKAPSLGKADAPFTLVEFSDFQCPFCVKAQPTIKALLAKYPDKVRLVFMHLPLPMHKQAKAAAQASWAAGQQGKFFEFHDQLFGLSEKIEASSFEQIAQNLKLDLVKFNKDRQSPEAIAQVEADINQAEGIGVEGTPTFVLNGVIVRGALALEDFEEVIKLIEAQKKS